MFQQNSAVMSFSQSPRTRIKTIASSNREGSKECAEIIENKFAILEKEIHLSQKERGLQLPSFENLDNSQIFESTVNKTENQTTDVNEKVRIERIRKDRKELLARIAAIKRDIADTEILEEELQRDIELEYALISGEYKSKMLEMEKLQHRKEKLTNCSRKLEENMLHRQSKQDEDQLKCKQKLEAAQKNMLRIEEKLTRTSKTDPKYEDVFEEYLKAQEVLDNERKAFEDLEFHHLEEEADWLASREEIQRELIDLCSRLEVVVGQIQDLEQQKYNILKNNNSEVEAIRKRRRDYLKQVEHLNILLKTIGNELTIFAEESSDSDSDNFENKSKSVSQLPFNLIRDLSCSVIISNSESHIDYASNMSQSLNEKLLQEKSVLESGIGTKCPSQDDIDRISKITSNAPININEEQGSLGRKTIESLKDIERRRHLHLCQQGSQVIEQERQRVLALKQRVQREVRTKWAQNKENCISGSTEIIIETQSGIEFSEAESECSNDQLSKSPTANEQIRSISDEPDSPRPMSEISELSTESANVVGKKRTKPKNDKQRPLTRYLPIKGSNLDLRQHIESAGHQVVLCPHVVINSSTCRGFLHKKGSKLNGWSKRWFVFDRNRHTLTYYNDKTEKKPRGGAYFQAIEEVYVDHLNSVKSPNPQLTFIVKTHGRCYYLMAPSPEAMRIWVDVIFTGAEGYKAFEHDN